MRQRRDLSSLIDCESGQASAEYILMLSIVLASLVVILKKLVKPLFDQIVAAVSTALEQRLFPGGDAFHRLRISR
jgi:Flp pilus assembly pilin Flp